MNRKLLTALCAVTAAATLFGCSNGGSSSSTPAPSSSTPEVVEATYPIVKDKLTITGIIISDGVTADEKPRQTWLKLAEVTNIDVDWSYIGRVDKVSQ